MKHKRFLFIMETPLTSWDVERLGFAIFLRHGMEVHVLDVGTLSMPEVRDHYKEQVALPSGAKVHVIQGYRQYHQTLTDLRENAVCFFFIGRDRLTVLAIMALTAWSGVKWGGGYLSAAGTHAMQVAEPKWRLLVSRVRRFSPRLVASYLLRKLFFAGAIRRFDFFLLGCRFNYKQMYHTGPETKILELGSFDHSLSVGKSYPEPVGRPTVVYLDDYFPYHPDLVTMGISYSEAQISEFFRLMNAYFDRMENELSVEVIIAAHPRSDNWGHHPKSWAGRKIISKRTHELVVNSRACIVISSTALNYAVLARKPVFFIGMPVLETGIGYETIGRYLASRLQRPFHRVERLDAMTQSDWDLEVNLRAYLNYEDEFIKFADAPPMPIWETVITTLLQK